MIWRGSLSGTNAQDICLFSKLDVQLYRCNKSGGVMEGEKKDSDYGIRIKTTKKYLTRENKCNCKCIYRERSLCIFFINLGIGLLFSLC